MPAEPQSEEWVADVLPRGRHKLPRDEVKASQRERLLRAMAEVVSEEGYQATTVTKVVARARVSSNTFYDFFPDKAGCFIAFCEQAGDDLYAEISSIAEEPDWITALDVGLDRYLRWWKERSALTVAYVVELPAAGRVAIEQRMRGIERFADLVRDLGRRARAADPGLAPLDEISVAVAVAAPEEIVEREVLAGRLDRIESVHDDLTQLMVKLLADDETARRWRATIEGGRPGQ